MLYIYIYIPMSVRCPSDVRPMSVRVRLCVFIRDYYFFLSPGKSPGVYPRLSASIRVYPRLSESIRVYPSHLLKSREIIFLLKSREIIFLLKSREIIFLLKSRDFIFNLILNFYWGLKTKK